MLSMTFGYMPTREQFDTCWDKTFENVDNALFSFGNDPRLGTCELTQDELWNELVVAYDEYSNSEEEDSEGEDTGLWMSSVLYCLDIEWI